jgi:glycine cleavage system H protein
VVEAPDQLNKDPYAAWLFRLKPAGDFDAGKLLDAAAYEKGLA